MKKDMSSDKAYSMDYQPSNKEFAGREFGRTNDYMNRTEREMNKEAGKIRKQAYKGKYD